MTLDRPIEKDRLEGWLLPLLWEGRLPLSSQAEFSGEILRIKGAYRDARTGQDHIIQAVRQIYETRPSSIPIGEHILVIIGANIEPVESSFRDAFKSTHS